MKSIRLATRKSNLALWQANRVKFLLETKLKIKSVELVLVSTKGDASATVPISQVKGQGIFVGEVRDAVLNLDADLCVHSAKDLPSTDHEKLLTRFVEREDPRDCLVGLNLKELKKGATVRTGSARRKVQLGSMVEGLNFEDLRGNIETRLAKIPEGGAIVMAVAAIKRLKLDSDKNVKFFPMDLSEMVPQVGQGAIAVESLRSNADLAQIVDQLSNPILDYELRAERMFLSSIGGGCEAAVGAFVKRAKDQNSYLSTAFIGDESTFDTKRIEVLSLDEEEPQSFGKRVADMLLSKFKI